MAKTTIGGIIWRIGRLLLLVFLGIFAFTVFFQSRFIYFPMRGLDGDPGDIGLDYEELTLETADGVSLHAWFIPAANSHGTVLFCHGNAGNISHRLATIGVFNSMGLDVLIFDYRGYGRSEGKPSEAGTYSDSAAAWRYLIEEKAIGPEKIVIFGRSLGGAVAAQLASEQDPAGLMVESAFTSIPDLAGDIYPYLPLKPLLRFSYSTIDSIAKINCPVLIAHSGEDEMIPFAHSEQLFAAAGEPKQFVRLNGGHNSGFLDSEQMYTEAVAKFLTLCGL